jgi:hypothetical protein
MSPPILTASPNHVTRGTPDSRMVRALRLDCPALEVRLVAARDDEDVVVRPVHAKAENRRSPTKADSAIACTEEAEVRRNADGSIDIAFYKERAQRLRREAALRLGRSIREFTRAWFRSVRS